MENTTYRLPFVRLLALAGLALVSSSAFAIESCAATNAATSEIVFGYESRWWSEQDELRPAVVRICGLNSRKTWKGNLTDATFDGASLYIGVCDDGKLTPEDRTCLARFQARGGQVMLPLHVGWYSRSVKYMSDSTP